MYGFFLLETSNFHAILVILHLLKKYKGYQLCTFFRTVFVLKVQSVICLIPFTLPASGGLLHPLLHTIHHGPAGLSARGTGCAGLVNT